MAMEQQFTNGIEAGATANAWPNSAAFMAGMTPVSYTHLPAEIIDKEKEILAAQIANDPKSKNKPEQIIAKMVEGRIGKYYKENCSVSYTHLQPRVANKQIYPFTLNLQLL